MSRVTNRKGTPSMMSGKYTVEGNLGLLVRLGGLFSDRAGH